VSARRTDFSYCVAPRMDTAKYARRRGRNPIVKGMAAAPGKKRERSLHRRRDASVLECCSEVGIFEFDGQFPIAHLRQADGSVMAVRSAAGSGGDWLLPKAMDKVKERFCSRTVVGQCLPVISGMQKFDGCDRVFTWTGEGFETFARS